VELNLTVDFDTRQLSGTAEHNMKVLETTNVAQFDIWDLNITGVYNSTDPSQSFEFDIAQPNPLIGSVL